MKPLFFPFTSLTKYDADSLLNYFETFSYLSTSSDEELVISEPDWFQNLWREKRLIEPITLSQDELTPLLKEIKEWRAWAEINYGKQTKKGYLREIFKVQPYLTSDSDIFAIRSQIEKGTNQIPKSNQSDNYQKIDNNSLLFLRLAAMADLENEVVDEKLSSIKEREADIFAELKGALDYNKDENSENPQLIADRGELMTEQRIRSWFNLFMSKKERFNGAAPNIFVTTSRAVVDFLISLSEKSKLMLDIDNFKVHKEKNSATDYELFQITEHQISAILAGLK